ncbi:MAG: DUF808 domain-containing protein [Bacteroidetes bacterium]|jgi:predicted DNA repair protein MutK|nr:DUF808 domain-containing protein [Bacteroidota bacterium]
MASGFFALLDDIGALMDDVALATKVASQKTAGILGDDLAVNAEKSTGFVSSRELPVLWEITKGSFLNKVIIIPIVFLLNVYLPVAITIILMVGGTYLAYEGVEKIVEYLFHRNHKKQNEVVLESVEKSADDEKKKIKDAIRTDFILSLEIVIIALSTVLNQELWLRIVTVGAVAIIATVGVYGVVALIVRMDDAGLKLIRRTDGKGFSGALGRLLVNALPVVVKMLSVIGTIALLMVAGGLFLHNVDYIHHLFINLPEVVASMIIGVVVGVATLFIVLSAKRMIKVIKG